jgi:DNA-binding SARP family transcriptional activator
VLAILVLHAGEVVSTERLIDELWGERPPASAAKTIQVYVSNLRKALGEGMLITRGRGYLLATERVEIDADRFESLVASARGAAASRRSGRRGVYSRVACGWSIAIANSTPRLSARNR